METMSSPTTQQNKNSRALSLGMLLIIGIGGYFVFRVFWNNRTSETRTDTFTIVDPINTAPTITAEVIRQKLLNGDHVIFLDVRDQTNYDAVHIPHSTLVSPGALNAHVADQNTTVVIVLSERDAQRKEAVTNLLKQKTSPAFLLKGGIEAWMQDGNPLIALGDPSSAVDRSKISPISPTEAQTLLSQSPLRLMILDVQSEQNFQKKHFKGALNIPLDQLERRSKEISPSQTILVYGEGEIASFQGGVRLNDLSIFTARTLSGNDHLKPGSGFILEP